MSQQIDSYIPDKIGSEDVLFEDFPFVGVIEFFDGVLIMAPAIVFVFIGSSILPPFAEGYSIFISVLIALGGISLLLVKPSYISLYDWIQSKIRYRRRQTQLEKNMTDDKGEAIKSYEAAPTEDTRRLTRIKEVYPNRNIIELESGDMISLLKFSGSNLDMASPDLRRRTVDAYSMSISSQLENDIQFYLPMRSVNLTSNREIYELNQNDTVESVENEEYMRQYLEDRVSWLSSLEENTYFREQYVVVKVSRNEALSKATATSGSSGLDELPFGEVVSDILKGASSDNRYKTEVAVKRDMFESIKGRRSDIGKTLSTGPGNEYEIVDTREVVSVLKEFWEGENIISDEMKSLDKKTGFVLPNGDKND